MAKIFEATIDGRVRTFPSAEVMIVESGDVSVIDYKGDTYPTEETIAALVALANTGGTEQVQLTVVGVADGTLQMSFPASGIVVNESTLYHSNSVITYQGNNYYVTESQEQIIAAANAGGGGGGTGTLQETLDEGSTLDKDNIVEIGVNYLKFKSTTENYITEVNIREGEVNVSVTDAVTNAYSEVLVADTVTLYKDDGAGNSKQLEIEPDAVTIDTNFSGKKPIATVAVADDFANDAAAALGGIPVGGCYHTAGVVKIRLS